MIDKEIKKKIRMDSAVKVILVNKDVIKGEVERSIPGYGVVIKTDSPHNSCPTKWEEIETAERIEDSEWKQKDYNPKGNWDNEFKKQVRNCPMVRITTRTGCKFTGKVSRYLGEAFYLTHPIYYYMFIQTDDVEKIEYLDEYGKFQFLRIIRDPEENKKN